MCIKLRLLFQCDKRKKLNKNLCNEKKNCFFLLFYFIFKTILLLLFYFEKKKTNSLTIECSIGLRDLKNVTLFGCRKYCYGLLCVCDSHGVITIVR